MMRRSAVAALAYATLAALSTAAPATTLAPTSFAFPRLMTPDFPRFHRFSQDPEQPAATHERGRKGKQPASSKTGAGGASPGPD